MALYLDWRVIFQVYLVPFNTDTVIKHTLRGFKDKEHVLWPIFSVSSTTLSKSPHLDYPGGEGGGVVSYSNGFFATTLRPSHKVDEQLDQLLRTVNSFGSDVLCNNLPANKIVTNSNDLMLFGYIPVDEGLAGAVALGKGPPLSQTADGGTQTRSRASPQNL